MSGFISEPLRTDERGDDSNRTNVGASHVSQRHDRFFNNASEKMTREEPKDGTDISATQKMLSAVSGSILTSLLGKALSARLKSYLSY